MSIWSIKLRLKLLKDFKQFFILSFHTSGISLDLREEELAEDAVEAGLQGSFLRRRALSRPFSLGEGSGVPRGEAGSWCETTISCMRTTFLCKVTKDTQHQTTTTTILTIKMLTSFETSTTKLSSLFSPSLSCKEVGNQLKTITSYNV